tara:strand:- start:442 stop:1059 length:618 start_codon:yes stop_codon:yes gene_type:complete
MQGKFITLEGIEGSGKSSNLECISNILQDHSIEFIVTKEPGGGPLGKDLRSILLNKDNVISSEAELLLMMADRKDHIDNLITPNLQKGIWVLSDRYLDSTYAYQGGGRKIDRSLIDELIIFLDLPKPDLTLLFDLPPEIALKRAIERSSLDRFETEPIDFHSRIRETYLQIADIESSRFKIIDSSLDFDAVRKQVSMIISDFINV